MDSANLMAFFSLKPTKELSSKDLSTKELSTKELSSKAPSSEKISSRTRVRFVALVFLLLLSWTQVLCSCSFMPPPPDDTKGVKDWVVVPVFYATNRAFSGKNGSIEYSEDENTAGLQFGVKNFVVPYPVRTPLDKKTEERMRWQRFDIDHDAMKLQPIAPPANLCSLINSTFNKEQMIAALDAYRKRAGSLESVVFVHGCCATFDTSALRAAKLATHMQVPVLLYDWVSPKGFKNYLKNETLAEQTVDCFLSALLASEKILGAENMSLVGHSMGAYILDHALMRRKPHGSDSARAPGKFRELIMSNADTDAKTFLNHAGDFASNARATRIYFSRSDDRLKYSAYSHGDFHRLGLPGPLAKLLAKVDGIQMIDVTDTKTNHELPFWLVSNMHRFGNLGPVKDFALERQDSGIFEVKRTAAPLAEPSGLE